MKECKDMVYKWNIIYVVLADNLSKQPLRKWGRKLVEARRYMV